MAKTLSDEDVELVAQRVVKLMAERLSSAELCIGLGLL
jgi:hypothetical protein